MDGVCLFLSIEMPNSDSHRSHDSTLTAVDILDVLKRIEMHSESTLARCLRRKAEFYLQQGALNTSCGHSGKDFHTLNCSLFVF